MENNQLVKIDEKTIRQIIADHYGVRLDDVCLYQDYRFVLRDDDKVREDYIYGIIEKSDLEVTIADAATSDIELERLEKSIKKCCCDERSWIASSLYPKPISPYVLLNAKNPTEGMTKEQKLDYDIFMYECAGNSQAANSLRLERYERQMNK